MPADLRAARSVTTKTSPSSTLPAVLGSWLEQCRAADDYADLLDRLEAAGFALIGEGDNAAALTIPGHPGIVLRIAAPADNFLTYAALLAGNPELLTHPCAPSIHDVAIGRNGMCLALVERLEGLKTYVGDIESFDELAEIAAAAVEAEAEDAADWDEFAEFYSRFVTVFSREERRAAAVVGDNGLPMHLDTEDNALYNIMVRGDRYVLIDPIGGALSDRSRRIIGRHAAAMKSAWPGLADTIDFVLAEAAPEATGPQQPAMD